ncbi:hypothetical protein SESBI_11545 [Sesbania bispinosa]|nr:hypothetical protein SESBI_11545 [Sesbania bispinosa]
METSSRTVTTLPLLASVKPSSATARFATLASSSTTLRRIYVVRRPMVCAQRRWWTMAAELAWERGREDGSHGGGRGRGC